MSMFAGGGFGQFGFAEHTYTPLDTSAFEAFLAEVVSKRCWLVELDAFSLGVAGGSSDAFGDHAFGVVGMAEAAAQTVVGLVTLRYASHGYTTQAADSPADTYYEARIGRQLPVVDRQIAGRDGIGGLTSVYAEVTLLNADGGLDTIKRNYSLEGRQARILIGRETDPRSSFGVLFTGVTSVADVNEDAMQLRLSDGVVKLRRKLANEAVYAGSGALEGGTDLKGKNKPVALGYCKNVPAPLVDSAKLIYQVSDGSIQDVPAVYDRGVALTKGADYADVADMNATAPAAGLYRVLKGSGYFRLGATPAGTVTADVEGENTGSFRSVTADIVLRVLSARAGLNSSEIDSTSFLQLAVDQPAPVGFWCGTEPVTCEALVDALLWGIGAFGGFSRFGAFTVGRVADATGVIESATITRLEIQKPGIRQEPLPAPVEPIAWRFSVGWGFNYAVQSDVAAATTAAQRTFAAEQIRYSTAGDTAIQSRHLLAQELRIDAYFNAETDAQAERDRLKNLWGVKRSVYDVPLKLPALMHDLGSVIRIEDYPRFGLAGGASGRVIGHRVEGARVNLKVLV